MRYHDDQPSTLADMDDATASLILQLMQEDGQAAAVALDPKGKQVAGIESDAQLALRLFLEEEVGGAEMFISDRRMTQSIARAVQLDGQACVLAEKQERLAAHDHQISDSLRREGGDGPVPTTAGIEPDVLYAEADGHKDFIEKLSYLYVTGTDGANFDNDDSDDEDDSFAFGRRPESSAWAAARIPTRSRQPAPRQGGIGRTHMRKCNSCLEMKHFSELAATPCKHEYCRNCFQQLFRNAITDETYFPPRCCKQAIQPGYQTRLFLTPQLVREFELKAIEYSSPDRTYCHEPACAAFVPPSSCQNSIATCKLCKRKTCTLCKQASHGGDCPSDTALQSVLALAKKNGWQRCQKCRTMVDLKQGCYHMSCRCGFQFCYLCGLKWKSCPCAHWEERNLLQRAVNIERRDNGPRAPAGQGRNQAVYGRRVAALMEDLRANHECNHAQWRERPGPGRCEECHDVMPQYVFECPECHIMACRRCRFNRMQVAAA
ncbi:E3 ubiquitin-protein ligase RNF144 [Microdochium nivale]|nr:E3 ubiquitin-protein ligase RNF144 [Microdochium nivale]